MIHLALWIASTLFVIWFFAVCGVLVLAFIVATWRWLLGGALLLGVAIATMVNWPEKTKQGTEVSVPAVPSPSPAQTATPDTPAEVRVVADSAPPIPEFANTEDRLTYLHWLGATSTRLKSKKPEWLERKEFLQTVWYESRRAGLDADLVLGMVETLSGFNKFHLMTNGSRGYMAVSPTWSRKIGDGDALKLFHMQTNLRFGCVILKRYIELHSGNVPAALADYYGSNLAGSAEHPSAPVFSAHVLSAASRWQL